MKFIKDIKEGDSIVGVYFCKMKNELKSKSDRPYYSLVLQDRTGILDGKVWDTNSNGIEDFEAGDLIQVQGQVNKYQSALQLSIIRIKKCSVDDYNLNDYIPTSKYDRDEMFHELMKILGTIKGSFHKKLLDSFFKDEAFVKEFKNHSAAKTMHHSFLGGLLEHCLSIVKICDFMSRQYPALNRDLLLTAAPLHDIGKIRELSTFPTNDYTDEGQLLGHIFIGANMVSEKIKNIPGFPKKLADEILHCILSHHGSLEYGSPKVPALMEAMALSMADNMDAKMQMFTELFDQNEGRTDWLGYQRNIETNVRIASNQKL